MRKYITDFDIIPDNNKIQTTRIQMAIDECAKKGDILEFEKGIYRTGTLFLPSNSKIVLSEGAEISGSENMDDYPDNKASFIDAVDQKRGKALIIAYRAENIEISGKGIICGNGKKLTDPTRPFLVRLVESKNVKIEKISLKNAAAWCLHINGSSYVEIDGITIDSRVNSNNDGIDIDASNHITVKNSHIMSGDDGICLKATKDAPCEYIEVENCKVSSGWGGFKIGTETVGDIRHISVKNCIFYDILGGGIKIVPTDGANVSDIKIGNIKMTNCTGPIFIMLGERLRKYAGVGRKSYSTIENITIENIEADVVTAPERGEYLGEIWGNAIGGIVITGTKRNYIKNLTLKNVKAELPGGIEVYEEHEVPYIGEKYPEFHALDILPSKGIYLRNADGITLENIDLTFKKNDIRKEFVAEECKNIRRI